MTDAVQKTIRRTRQYWHVDGFAEIWVGLLFLLIGLIFYGQALVPARSAAGISLQFAFPALFLVGMWIARPLIKGLKERVTYPRTGYVAYQRPPRRTRLIGGAVAAIIAVLIASLVARGRPVLLDWIPAGEGSLPVSCSFWLDRGWLASG